MKQRFFIGVLLATALWFVIADARLRIGAFNIQILGATKMSKPFVVENLVRIIRRYDILFVQEIKDIKVVVPYQLLDAINQGSEVKYNVTISERLGRSESSKESYAYYYRNNIDSGIKLIDAYVFNDTDDKFERPPYVAKFNLTDVSTLNHLTLIGVHVKPGSVNATTLKEILALREVHNDTIERWGDDNAIIFGDMNADCTYLTKVQKAELATHMYTLYDWLIGDNANTNIATTTNCTYDRILAAGNDMKNAIVRGSAKPYYFDQAYDLDKNTARNISDHYPVEFELKNANERLLDRIASHESQPIVERRAG